MKPAVEKPAKTIEETVKISKIEYKIIKVEAL